MATVATIDRIVTRLSRLGQRHRLEQPEAPEPKPAESQQPHPIFGPGNQWKDASKHFHTNQVWRVKTPEHGEFFVKHPRENPVEAHTEQAARDTMRELGFHEIPEAKIATHPASETQFVASPWQDVHRNLREHISFHGDRYRHPNFADELGFRLQNYGSKRIGNLMTAHWLLHALDRNGGNYAFGHDGRVIPMDYGETFSVLPWELHGKDADMRQNRITSPHQDSLFEAAMDQGLIRIDHPLDPAFLDKLKMHQPSIESKFYEDVAPYLPPHDASTAASVLQEKFDHLDSLINWSKEPSRDPPSLEDLSKYKGMRRVR